MSAAVLFQQQGATGFEGEDLDPGGDAGFERLRAEAGNVESHVVLFFGHLDRHGAAFLSRQFAPTPQTGIGPLESFHRQHGAASHHHGLANLQPGDLFSTGQVLDTIAVTYNVGHLLVPGGDSAKPYGKYVISLNKLSHGQHVNVGPSQPESTQLIDITGDKMKMLYLAFTEPEPHYAQACPVSLLKPIEVYPLEENKDPKAIKDIKDARIERNGTKVEV